MLEVTKKKENFCQKHEEKHEEIQLISSEGDQSWWMRWCYQRPARKREREKPSGESHDENIPGSRISNR